MGCAPSRDPADSTIFYSSAAVSRSLTLSYFPIVVHHPPLFSGDNAPIVSLTSTTYNFPLSLLHNTLIPNPDQEEASMDSSSSPSSNKFPQFLPRSFTYHHHYRGAAKPIKPLWLHFADDCAKPKPSPAAVVLYTTLLRGIRWTHADCCAVRSMLRGFRVAVDERDVSMDAALRRELQSLLPKAATFSLPQLFVGGRLVGGAEEARRLHEAGELGSVLEGAGRADPSFVCGGCGGARFVPCMDCSGSRKIFEEEEGRMRRCEGCNENGLARCTHCSSSF